MKRSEGRVKGQQLLKKHERDPAMTCQTTKPCSPVSGHEIVFSFILDSSIYFRPLNVGKVHVRSTCFCCSIPEVVNIV